MGKSRIIFSTNFLPLLLLFLIPFLLYWQIGLMQYTMKWDMMDIFFPWRFHISESIRNGFLPLWNPYINMGYPIIADPGSGAWYPVVWILSLIGYTVYTIQFEFLLHIAIAGVGMYCLIRYFGVNKIAAFAVAVAFEGCGIFVSNAQHLTWIISISWICWILLFYFKSAERFNIRNILFTALFLTLMLTGGYPAFFILLQYVLAAIFIYFLIFFYRIKDFSTFKKFIYTNVLIYGTFFILSFGFLYTFFKTLSFITRNVNPLESALHGAFTVPSAMSFIFPYATASDAGIFGSDISMINGYFGIFIVIFLFYALFGQKNKKVFLLFFASLFFLAASFGDALPVREWLYHYIPMLDKFRFPSLFRTFSVVGFLILGGIGLHHFIQTKNKKILLLISSIFFLGIIFCTNFFFFKSGFAFTSFWDPEVYLKEIEQTTIHQRIVFQGMILTVLLGIFVFVLFKVKDQKSLLKILSLLIFLDILQAVQLNMPATVASDAQVAKVDREIRKLPKGFPIPNLTSMAEAGGNFIYPMWYNQNIFHKIPGLPAYNSFLLRQHEDFLNSPEKDSILKYPLVYFIDDANMKGAISLIDFGPNHLTVMLEGKSGKIYFLQNDYPGWQIEINGEEKKAGTTHHNHLFAEIPENTTRITFTFNPQPEKLLLIINFVQYIILIGLIFYFHKKKITATPAPGS